MADNTGTVNEGNDHWGTTLLEDARKNNALITAAVTDYIDLMLKGELSEKSLTSKDLKQAANELLGHMNPEKTSQEASE